MIFEEDLATTESSRINKEIQIAFDCVFNENCKRSGMILSNTQNTGMFLSGSVTRLLLPPKTHHAVDIKRVSGNMYVAIKI